MTKILINEKEHEMEQGLTVLQALIVAGVQVPRFCYHERLKIAGNCRMCLVEIAPGPPKPQASCAINISDGMSIKTETEMVKKAREGVMEFLLVNHPLDCPICDQGGECDLQDQAFIYGKDISRLRETKRAVEDKNMGPFIKTAMNRCIHCTRCVRFMEDIAGTGEIGAFGRGNEMEIATFLNEGIRSELSANIIDLCPVGALLAKPYSANYRPWELTKVNSIDVMDGLGSAISVQSKANEVIRILPRINEEINEEWLSDKSRFAVDGLLNQRLDRAYIRNREGRLVESSLREALKAAASKIQGLNKPEELAILTGDFTDAETIFALKDLASSIGTPYIESRQKPFNIDISSRQNYIFNSKFSGLEEADLIIIVGSNIKKEAPVLNARIRRNIMERKIPAYLIGSPINLTYPTQNIGAEKSSLNRILDGTSPLCAELIKARKPLLICGADAFKEEDGMQIHQSLLRISEQYLQRENWNGFNMLHQNSSIVAALDANFIYHGGLKEIIEKAESGAIKVIYALGADEIDLPPLPNTFIIYQGTHGDRLVERADIILPSTAYTEKDATFINTEGRSQKTCKAVNPKGEATDDNEIIIRLASYLEIKVSSEIEENRFPKIAAPAFSLHEISGLFSLSATSFYMGNYISRNSKNMALALKELKG